MNVNNRRPKMCTFIKRSYHKTHSDSKSFLILKLFVLGLEKYFEFDSTLNKFLSRQLLSRVMGNTNLEISFYKNTLTGYFLLVLMYIQLFQSIIFRILVMNFGYIM